MVSRKNIGIVPIIGGMIVLVVVSFILFVLPNLLQPTTILRLGDGVFKTQVAATSDSRTKGLSGIVKLNSDQALLMVFPDQGKWGIWMKDMKFPIDIVWLNSDKKVVYAVMNVPFEDQTTVFSPKYPAKYVLELPAGTVKGKAININSTADFQIDKVRE